VEGTELKNLFAKGSRSSTIVEASEEQEQDRILNETSDVLKPSSFHRQEKWKNGKGPSYIPYHTLFSLLT